MVAVEYTIGGSEVIAWAAGLFEGEGCFYGSGARIRASLISTDEDVVRRFHAVVGVGVIYRPYERRPRCKPSWKWEASTEPEYREIVRLFLPYLCERRATRALELLAEREAHIAAHTAPRTCLHCGETFRRKWHGSRPRVYCAVRCKDAAAYARRKAAA